MAEIRILPARLPDADQIRRLIADLAGAQERGVDLGSRAAHIQANGETLLAMSRGLEHACGALRRALFSSWLIKAGVSRTPTRSG